MQLETVLFEQSLGIKLRGLMSWKCRIDHTPHKQIELKKKKRKRLKIASASKKALDLPYAKRNIPNVDILSINSIFLE